MLLKLYILIFIGVVDIVDFIYSIYSSLFNRIYEKLDSVLIERFKRKIVTGSTKNLEMNI